MKNELGNIHVNLFVSHNWKKVLTTFKNLFNRA